VIGGFAVIYCCIETLQESFVDG